MTKKERKGVIKSSKGVKMGEVTKANGIKIQRLIVDADGSSDIHMRKFTMEPGGDMVLHKHKNTDHVQYVLKGKIKIILDGTDHIVDKDDAIFIPKNTEHSYENIGEKEAVFLCMVSAVDVDTEVME